MAKDRSTEGLSRRQMGAASMAAGMIAATGLPAQAGLPTTESDVTVKTPDGECDAAFFHPASGSYPGVIIWTDAFGLRPAFRDMGRRLAAEGYAVLVPNPYYRAGKASVSAGLSFTNPDDRAKLMALMGSLTTDVAATDAKAYVAYLDAQHAVTKMAQIGVQGYCMGGRLTMITAATVPARIGAGASFHGGNLVTDKPDSPHLMVSQMKAQFYFGISAEDDQKQPDAKGKLKTAFASANLPAEIKVYDGTLHGWCVPDMPSRDGKQVYDHAKAEDAWDHLLKLYRKALA